MTEVFKRLNAKVEALLQENAKLMEKVQSLKGKGTIQQIHTSTQTSELSCPSQDKIDEQGVHSPTNAKRFTVSDKDTASPVQTEQNKHVLPTSIPAPNPDPNGDRLIPDIKRINIEQDRSNTSSRRDRSGNNNVTRSLSSGEEDYGEHAYYQDAQDPNEDDDSGISFDSIALHNLDT
ncbi:hypothetical protein H5410_064306 [Solanum commersonii]|uniref:Uncharacterized protein n=1 Tax=Solanum commersonii TaxID=4109 RepID=A0A9J5VZS9_SOLCO|nr:hypothetical protein H5410_064306 [Solanum commersonii]